MRQFTFWWVTEVKNNNNYINAVNTYYSRLEMRPNYQIVGVEQWVFLSLQLSFAWWIFFLSHNTFWFSSIIIISETFSFPCRLDFLVIFVFTVLECLVTCWTITAIHLDHSVLNWVKLLILRLFLNKDMLFSFCTISNLLLQELSC